MKHKPNADWRRAILYHIYPLSFADANGDGFGDLEGIISHLDYLAGQPDSLGVSAIWLSPVYQSPMKDFGYDVLDYEAIDPVFGSLETMDLLINQAHQRGLKVLMDYVANHTSDQHAWFKESRSSRNNPKRDWYIWADPKPDGSAPNNWLSVFGGPSWALDEATGQYYLHTFLTEQPDVNWRNPEVRAAMLDVLRFWLGRGIDGFRIDAVYDIMKDAKLRDEPVNPSYKPGIDDPFNALLHVRSEGQAELVAVVNDIGGVLAEYPDRFMVSEAYLGIRDMAWLYQAGHHHNHAPFNFNLMSLPWDAQAFGQFIGDYEASLRPDDIPNYVLSNHDRVRLVSRVGKSRAQLLAMLQLTLRGMPVIYYGDEIGMTNAVISATDERDPWGKQVRGFGLGRDGARTPMRWNPRKLAGFTTGPPWLPLGEDVETVNAETEKAQPDSFWALYHKLIQLRHDHDALSIGSYQAVELGPDVLAFDRSNGVETFRIVLNFGPKSFHLGEAPGKLVATTGTSDAVIAAREGRVYQLETK